MASSAHDQLKIELVGVPANSELSVSTAPQAAAASEDQPALGYPPVIGYPQGDPRYLGSYPYPYPYPAQPPNIHGSYPDPDRDASSYTQQMQSHSSPRLRRRILAASTISAFLLVTAIAVVQLVLLHRMPDFLLTEFAVSDLNVSSDSIMLANLEANITVENWNSLVRLEVTSLPSMIYYSDPSQHLSSVDIDGPLNLGAWSTRVVNLEMSTLASNQPEMRTVKAVRTNLQINKRMAFGVEVYVAGKFKYSWWWKKRMAVMAYCEDLWVDFTESGLGSSASGSLAAEYIPTKCLIPSYNSSP